MKERPILFSGPMVRAILAGAKTQTRRVIQFPPRGAFVLVEQSDGSLWPYASDDGESQICNDNCEHPMACPYGKPGDRLWVRETFALHRIHDQTPASKVIPTLLRGVVYRADGQPDGAIGRWRPSIYMPRWASRITLEVESVRVERVQEISDEDAKAEGVDAVSMADVPRQATLTRRADFRQLWDTINGKRAPWASNPLVWVVTFTTCPAHAPKPKGDAKR